MSTVTTRRAAALAVQDPQSPVEEPQPREAFVPEPTEIEDTPSIRAASNPSNLRRSSNSPNQLQGDKGAAGFIPIIVQQGGPQGAAGPPSGGDHSSLSGAPSTSSSSRRRRNNRKKGRKRGLQPPPHPPGGGGGGGGDDSDDDGTNSTFSSASHQGGQSSTGFNPNTHLLGSLLERLVDAQTKSADKPATSSKSSDVRKPDRYDGTDRYKFQAFKAQCKLHYLADPTKYKTDLSKVVFAGSFLAGQAARYFEDGINNDDEPLWMSSYTLFLSTIETMFGDTDASATAERKLQSLRMRPSEVVSNYHIAFNNLCHQLDEGWGEKRIIQLYRQGLAHRLLERLLNLENLPVTLHAWQQQALKFDNRHWELEAEKHPVRIYSSTEDPAMKLSSTSSNTRLKPSQSKGGRSASAAPSNSSNSSKPSTPSKNPSNSEAKPHSEHLGPDGKLKPEVKEYRAKNNLCSFCGEKHSYEDCTKRPNKSGRVRAVQEHDSDEDQRTVIYHYSPRVEEPSSSDSESEEEEEVAHGTIDHVRLHVNTVQGAPSRLALMATPEGHPHLSVPVLLDSGASGTFFDRNFVKSVGGPITPCAEHRFDLFGGGPAPFGVVRATSTLTLHLGDDPAAVATITGFVPDADLPDPITLGYDFLHKFNPVINWVNMSLELQTPTSTPFQPSVHASLENRQMAMSFAKHVTDLHGPPMLSVNHLEEHEAPSMYVGALVEGIAEPIPLALDDKEGSSLQSTIPSQYHAFLPVFSKKHADQLPPHRPFDMQLKMLDGKLPSVGPIYSMSKPELQTVREWLDDMLGKKFIRPSTSPIRAPVLFVKKKDGSLRLCVDYRRLNLLTEKDRYPLPLIDNLLEVLSGATKFTKLDLRAAYNLVRIKEGDEWLTAFGTRYGQFEFLVMPFGLTNAPPVFQRLVNTVLQPYLDVFVIIYIDDIVIFSQPHEDHDEHVKMVLDILLSNGLFVKGEKCEWGVSETEFLGFVVGTKGIRTDPGKVKTVMDWPVPASIKGIQSFLGFCNFYRRFVEGYSKIACPLTQATRGDKFVWTPECLSAFNRLKGAFEKAPLLHHFNPSLETIVETDSSDYAMGAVLSQVGTDGKWYLVAVLSRGLTGAELNYEIHDKEMLVIVWSFGKWRSMLQSTQNQITVYSDNKSLTYFMSTKVLNRRQARWAEKLADFDFLIVYRPGKQGTKPDTLSRREDYIPSGEGAYARSNPQNHRPLLKQGTLAALTTASTSTSNSVELLEAIRTAQEPSKRDLLASHKSFDLRDDLLVFDGRIWVPPQARDLHLAILRSRHDHILAGHPGRTKTLQLVSRDFYWTGMAKYVDQYVAGCHSCMRAKPLHHRKFGQLVPLPIAKAPWVSISMDFIDQLPPSRGCDAILVVVDRLTKYAIFTETTTTCTSEDLANLYLKRVFSQHGLPSDIVSDRGSKFTSKFWKSLQEALGIVQNLSTAYHPESDGQTERVNQVLEQFIRLYVNYNQDDWVDLLPIAEFVYNNTPHSTTKVSPFFANYGYNPRFEISVPSARASPSEDLVERLAAIHTSLQEEIAKANAVNERTANRKRLEAPPLAVGDRVWLATKNLKVDRPSRKFSARRIGPFAIEKVISPVAFRLKLPPAFQALHPVFHVSLLEPCKVDEISGRVQPPPPPEPIMGEEEYVVERIVDSAVRNRRFAYRVEWKGYDDDSDRFSWEPPEHVANAQDLVDAFHLAYPDKPRPSSASTPSKVSGSPQPPIASQPPKPPKLSKPSRASKPSNTSSRRQSTRLQQQ